MAKHSRRRFLQAGATTAAMAAAVPAFGAGYSRAAGGRTNGGAGERAVRFSGDGIGLSPAEYVRLLNRIAAEKGIAPDSYSIGGVVEELEGHFARVLGKERAIFFPTGTMANHLAVRALSGARGRIIVQEQSHLYQDEGDCAQTLSHLTLMPLARGAATFTAEEVQQVIDETRSGRVPSRVSVISIESPVRRRLGERFDSAELEKIVTLARREGIKLHLDGARMFLQAAYTGQDVAAMAAPFDTVYVSLYKYFNAASGAILAGPRSLLEGMHHERRMFGGGLSDVWPFAAVALHYAPGFSERYSTAVKASEEMIRSLERRAGFAVERIPAGTNLFRLRVKTPDPRAFQTRLAVAGIQVSAPRGDTFVLAVNETVNRATAGELTSAFVGALGG